MKKIHSIPIIFIFTFLIFNSAINSFCLDQPLPHQKYLWPIIKEPKIVKKLSRGEGLEATPEEYLIGNAQAIFEFQNRLVNGLGSNLSFDKISPKDLMKIIDDIKRGHDKFKYFTLYSRNRMGFNIFSYAILHGNIKLVEYIIQLNKQVVLEQTSENTLPLQLAVGDKESMNFEMVKCLVNAGAQVNARPMKSTNYLPLEAVALRSQNKKMIKFLISKGAKITLNYFSYLVTFNNKDVLGEIMLEMESWNLWMCSMNFHKDNAFYLLPKDIKRKINKEYNPIVRYDND